MAYAKLQQGTDNKQLGTGGMTGGAAPGQTGGTAGASGQPSGFTNIQDYMRANAGDTTNQNYLNTKTDEKLGALKNTLSQEQSNLAGTITQKPEANNENLRNILDKNDYTSAYNYVSPQTFTPTSQELTDPNASDTGKKISGLQGNIPSIMDYIGSLKPISQSYTPGMSTFDEMLLGGDKEFAKNFADAKKSQYQSDVVNPYQEAFASREKEKSDYNASTDQWKGKINEYLGQQKKTVDNILEQQSKTRPAITGADISGTLNLNDPEWYAGMLASKPEFGTYLQSNPEWFYDYTAPIYNQATAGQEYINKNPSDAEDYNNLVQLLGGKVDSSYTPIFGGQNFTPEQYLLNLNKHGQWDTWTTPGSGGPATAHKYSGSNKIF